MAAFNQTTIVGNLTADPDLKYTPKGKAVCTFDVAINHSFKTADGEKKDEVSFIPVVVWGKQAETVAEYMKKGRLILVSGKLHQERWEKDGKKRSRIKINANNTVFLGTPGKKETPKEEPPASDQAQSS